MEPENEKNVKERVLVECVLEDFISPIILEKKSDGSYVFIKKYSQGNSTLKEN